MKTVDKVVREIRSRHYTGYVQRHTRGSKIQYSYYFNIGGEKTQPEYFDSRAVCDEEMIKKAIQIFDAKEKENEKIRN